MTAKPTRAEVDGRSYLDLQNLARRTNRPTDELLQLFALEGFLGRLAQSDLSDTLVLKGGVLLAAFGTRRPTRDIDLHALAHSNELDAVRTMACGILRLGREDGLEFNADSAQAELIRDADTYSGVRVSVTGRLARAQLHFHIDVNVGDPVWPAPQVIDLPLLLGGHIKLLGYPLVMVFAEKLLTAIERGTANTRWRDFADMYLLSGRHSVDAAELARAIAEVATFRTIQPLALAAVLDGYSELGQAPWLVWRRKQRLEDRLPAEFAAVVAAVAAFADSVLDGSRTHGRWQPDRRTWVG